MEFTFTVSPEGMGFIKQNIASTYPNISYDGDKSTITMELPEPNTSTIGQFMTAIKETGLLIGKEHGESIVLDSKHITEYPYELEAF